MNGEYIGEYRFHDRLTFRTTRERLILLSPQSYPRSCLSILRKGYEKDSFWNEG